MLRFNTIKNKLAVLSSNDTRSAEEISSAANELCSMTMELTQSISIYKT